jgi:hypothetical protein
MRKFVALSFAALLTVGCGGDDSPSAPTPQIPNVVGSYTGSTTILFPELNQRVSCPTSTTVTQNGSIVNFSPMVLSGQCQGVSLPLGQTTIDATGAFANESGSYRDPSCGTYTYTASGGFFGREIRWSGIYISSTCYNMNITFNLTR